MWRSEASFGSQFPPSAMWVQRWHLGHQPLWLSHLTDPGLDFWDKVLLCSPCWPGTHYVAHAGLKLIVILLSQFLEHWDFRYVSPHPAAKFVNATPSLMSPGMSGSAVMAELALSPVPKAEPVGFSSMAPSPCFSLLQHG